MKEFHCAKPQQLSWPRRSCNQFRWKVANLATVGFSLQLFAPVATWSQIGFFNMFIIERLWISIIYFPGIFGWMTYSHLKASLLNFCSLKDLHYDFFGGKMKISLDAKVTILWELVYVMERFGPKWELELRPIWSAAGRQQVSPRNFAVVLRVCPPNSKRPTWIFF